MKKALPFVTVLSIFIISACSGHKYYTTSTFDQKTASHRLVAILPAEMIFTGKKPENLTADDIAKLEESESRSFQQSLYNSILRYANSRKYFTSVDFQDAVITQKILEENNINVRETWKHDDKELAKMLGVDAVVRMRIQKQRYMSDVASYGVSVGRRIISGTSIGSKLPIPYNVGKTNDIYASCNIVSNNQTLWNDSYKGSSDWNTPADVVIDNITDNFGRHFPYKKRR